jgi:hypothetical protein
MKKILAIVIVMFLAVPAFAANNQAAKGNIVVTLPLFSYWTGMGDLDNSSYFSFLAMGYEPEVQYCIIDNLAIGGKVGYRNDKSSGGSVKTTSFGPLANYYFGFVKAPVLPYAGAGILIEKTKPADITETSLKLQGGAVYNFYKNLSAYGEVFLSYVRMKNGETVTGERVGFALGVKAFF